MFKDSLVESQPNPIPAATQWTTAASIAIQSTAAALIVILPLVHPERLPMHIDPPRLFTPPRPKPVIHVRPAAASSSPASSALPAIPTQQSPIPSIAKNLSFRPGNEPAPPLAPFGPGMADSAGLAAALTTVSSASTVSAVPVHFNARPRISEGIAAGMLLAPIRPIYPPIARAAHVEGTVVVEATISCTGTIESLHVVSGPEMLRSAAISAIQAARYRPYRLNGEPVDVQTTITVNFRLGS